MREVLIDWLAAGLNPGRGDAVHPVARARARRAAPAAVDDHAARLARARAELQGPAGAAQGEGPRHLRLPRLSAAAERRHPGVPRRLRAGGRGPGGARGADARDGAALQSPVRPRAGLRGEGGSGREEPRRPQHHQLPAAAPQVPGSRRHRGAGSAPGRWCRATTASPSPTASGCSAFCEGTGVTILPEPQVLLTATPKVPGLDGRKMSKSYGNTIGLREEPDEVVEEAARHADRPGARAAHRSGRSGQVPGVGPAQDLFRRGDPQVGGRGLPHGRHRLPGLQAAA